MPSVRPHHRLPAALAAAAATLVVALAGAAPAAADELQSDLGSSQVCVGVSGGFLLRVGGFGTGYPPNTSGTTTFHLANGNVITLTAATGDEGVFQAGSFDLDMRDPAIRALAGTSVYETGVFGSADTNMTFILESCPTAPAIPSDCTGGGFGRYPVLGFKNQGDCISWLATHGKNEPGQNLP